MWEWLGTWSPEVAVTVWARREEGPHEGGGGRDEL